jgi:hypothetical protein
MNWTIVTVGTLGGMLAAMRADLRSFIKARKEDPTAKFDFALAFASWAEGAIIGALPGLGYGAVTGG